MGERTLNFTDFVIELIKKLDFALYKFGEKIL